MGCASARDRPRAVCGVRAQRLRAQPPFVVEGTLHLCRAWASRAVPFESPVGGCWCQAFLDLGFAQGAAVRLHLWRGRERIVADASSRLPFCVARVVRSLLLCWVGPEVLVVGVSRCHAQPHP